MVNSLVCLRVSKRCNFSYNEELVVKCEGLYRMRSETKDHTRGGCKFGRKLKYNVFQTLLPL